MNERLSLRQLALPTLDLNQPKMPLKILTMEDDEVIRRSMAEYLADRGFTVLETADGRAGLEMFRAEKPDILLVDLRMPEIDGMQVIETVAGESPDTPMIVVSGNNAVSGAVEALRLGAWDYLLKPIEDMGMLLHAVETSLERSRLKKENRRYQENLEELVRRRTAELEAKNAELERFTYTVSHDLKSPLITIKGFLGIMEQDLGDKCTPEVAQHMQRIAAAADRMFHFLEDLLEMSRVGRLVNPPGDNKLTEIVAEAIDLVLGPIAEAGIEVVVDENLPAVWGDRVRLREVYQNLIENAAKYMGTQPHPKIEIGMRQGVADETGKTVFFVRDNGIGIDPRFQEKIFGLFDKLDPKSEGTGVGLSLVRRIIEVHGGRIWIESAGEGMGSTFCFTLAGRTQP